MFHTYVQAAAKRPDGGWKCVDIDRATFLMDKDLFQRTLDAMKDERGNHPRWDADYGAQWVWDYYCQRHVEKFGESFTPDVDPVWDT